MVDKKKQVVFFMGVLAQLEFKQASKGLFFLSLSDCNPASNQSLVCRRCLRCCLPRRRVISHGPGNRTLGNAQTRLAHGNSRTSLTHQRHQESVCPLPTSKLAAATASASPANILRDVQRGLLTPTSTAPSIFHNHHQ